MDLNKDLLIATFFTIGFSIKVLALRLEGKCFVSLFKALALVVYIRHSITSRLAVG
jgi:hypothetical protein